MQRLDVDATYDKLVPVAAAVIDHPRPSGSALRAPSGVRVGALFSATRPIAELPATARKVESLGFDALWLTEDCFLHSGPAAAATALAVTRHIRVGIGLLPVSVRNPAIVAMELATLANLHPNRVEAAFGHGVESWMLQVGARPPDRIAALREVVGSTRALLHGEEVSRQGRFVSLTSVRLDQPPSVAPPLLIGTTGERGMATARAVADGLVLPEGSSAEAVRWATDQAGVQKLVVYAWMRIGEDGGAARAGLAPMVRAWRDEGLFPNLVSRADAHHGEVDDDLIRRVAVAGTARDCAQAVLDLAAAGADSVVLAPTGANPSRQLEHFAEAALPLVATSPAGSRLESP